MSAMCIRRRLTRTGGWVGPKEHHQEVSPAGCSVASYKAHTYYTVYVSCLYFMKFSYWMCVHMRERECNGQDKNFIVREIWHKKERASESLKRSREWRVEQKRKSLPGWAADVILKRLEQKWGGSGKQTIDLSLYSPSLAFSIYLTLFLQFYCDKST